MIRKRYSSTRHLSLPKKKSLATKSYVKRVVKNNTEVKYFSRNEEDVAVGGTTGIFRSLSKIPQGDGDGNRDGNIVNAKYLIIRGRLANADASGNLLRIIVVRYYGSGSTVGATDFPTTQAGSTTNGPLCAWQGFQLQKMKVLKDVTFKTDPDDPNVPFKLKVKVNSKIAYGSSTTAEAAHNDLVMFAISDSSVTSHPNISYQSQLSYTD